METRLGVYGWGLSCQSLDFFTGDWGQVLFCQEARLHGCALPPPGTKLQSSQSRDLVPTWPVGDGCNMETPALIAKAGVSKAPEIPGAQGTGMCADFIRRWAVAAILRAAQAGCKGVDSMAGEGVRGGPTAATWCDNPVISQRKSHGLGRLCSQWATHRKNPGRPVLCS